MKVLRCFKEVSRKLSGCFKKVSCCMALIAASRAEGGLVCSVLYGLKKCDDLDI